MRAVCTIVMLEIFIYTKHIFNQSPYDEVIGKLGKEKFAFTIERLSLSDFSSEFGLFVRRRDKKLLLMSRWVRR